MKGALYPKNLKSWFWSSSVLPSIFRPHSCLAPPCPNPNSSSCLGIYGIIVSQFFATFIEYAVKLMIFTLATRPLFGLTSHSVATLSAFAFLLPMLFFSLPAGLLVDRFCKRTVIIASKLVDISLLVAMTLCLYLAPDQLLFPFLMLGLLGISSALFNPAKGSLLPEILTPERLGRGNGLLELWTMLAVIAGYGLGPALLAADQGGVKPHLTWIGPALLALLAIISLSAAYFLPKSKRPAAPERGGYREALLAVKKDPVLSIMLLANVLFWIVITYFGQNVLVETKQLVGSEIWQGVSLAAYWLGIALGSLGGGRLPVEKVRRGPKFCALAWFFAVWALFRYLHPGLAGSCLVLLLMGLASGFLLVPIMAIIQHRAPKSRRGAVLAFNNVLNILGILLGSYFAMSLG